MPSSGARPLRQATEQQLKATLLHPRTRDSVADRLRPRQPPLRLREPKRQPDVYQPIMTLSLVRGCRSVASELLFVSSAEKGGAPLDGTAAVCADPATGRQAQRRTSDDHCRDRWSASFVGSRAASKQRSALSRLLRSQVLQFAGRSGMMPECNTLETDRVMPGDLFPLRALRFERYLAVRNASRSRVRPGLPFSRLLGGSCRSRCGCRLC